MDIDYSKDIAVEVLNTFEDVETKTRRQLNSLSNSNTSINNTFNHIEALNNELRIFTETKSSLENAFKEPAISRVVIQYDNGRKKTVYITRSTPPSELDNFASYRSPIGRLASIQIGDEFELPNGEYVVAISRVILKPNKNNGSWDSQDSEFEELQKTLFTVSSLRKLLEDNDSPGPSEDFDFDKFISTENSTSSTNILEGRKRDIISNIGLRDQAILDPFQDKIFRLPIDKKIMIFGPPGTGKTTTLIRRLGQKLNGEFLSVEEKRLISADQSISSQEYTTDWLMFTPTELLKHYLKEAFSREGIAAPDSNVRTWKSFSHDHAKSTFKILRSGDTKSGFIFRDGDTKLTSSAMNTQIEFFESFQKFQFEEFSITSKQLASKLNSIVTPELVEILEVLNNLDNYDQLYNISKMIQKHSELINKLRQQAKEDADQIFSRHINFTVNNNNNFLNDFASFLSKLNEDIERPNVENISADQADDYFNETDDSDINSETSRVSERQAAISLKQYLANQARNAARGHQTNEATKLYSVLTWLNDKSLPEYDAIRAGKKLIQSQLFLNLENLINRFFSRLPVSYKNFRRKNSGEGFWFKNLDDGDNDIGQTELDCIILLHLKNANYLLSKADIKRDLENKVWSSVRETFLIQKMQIYVDEATDFSPIQLSCLAELSQSKSGSFFASGDFNQRLTTFGTRSEQELFWSVGGIQLEHIDIPYRQSQYLNAFANKIIGNSESIDTPVYGNHKGFKPSLLINAGSVAECINWIATRIIEVENILHRLPSTAVFVNSEDEVEHVSELLEQLLNSKNINVEACKDGRMLGEGQNVRVFSIEHIKGLEFEAVFFVSIDTLYSMDPELFTKFLYVGATRAATFLGITSVQKLPQVIDDLKDDFVSLWKD